MLKVLLVLDASGRRQREEVDAVSVVVAIALVDADDEDVAVVAAVDPIAAKERDV